jgi:hypothetical protein
MTVTGSAVNRFPPRFLAVATGALSGASADLAEPLGVRASLDERGTLCSPSKRFLVHDRDHDARFSGIGHRAVSA